MLNSWLRSSVLTKKNQLKNSHAWAPLRLIGGLPVVAYGGESIFEYKYLLEYEAKIESALHGALGP